MMSTTNYNDLIGGPEDQLTRVRNMLLAELQSQHPELIIHDSSKSLPENTTRYALAFENAPLETLLHLIVPDVINSCYHTIQQHGYTNIYQFALEFDAVYSLFTLSFRC